MRIDKKKFTLVEMITVIAVVGVLFAIMLPSFNRMISGSKVNQMASNLKLGLEQAQSYAITSRKHVALIIPSNYDPTAASPTANSQYCFGGYRMAYVSYNSNTNRATFENWIPESEWKNKPNGAMLLQIMNDGEATYNVYDKNESGGKPKDTIQEFTDKFDMKSLSLTNLTNINSFSNNNADENPGSNSSCAIIFSPYGGVRMNNNSLKFIIAETLIDSNIARVINRYNYTVLELNKYTGRVSYK